MDKILGGIAQIIPDQRYIVGKKWNLCPISHDIFRNEYWIYTEHVILGISCLFFKFDPLPTQEESDTLEWKTVDLINHIDKYSCRYSHKRTVQDIITAVINNQLQFKVLYNMAYKYGVELTKSILETVVNNSKYLGTTKDKFLLS